MLGAATFLVFEAYAFTKHNKNDASNSHQLNPAAISFQRQRGDLQPVSFLHKPSKRLYDKHRFQKRFEGPLTKRDYATTLKYLRAAMNSYRKDLVAPPPVELIQLQEQLPPSPVATPPAPPTLAYYPSSSLPPGALVYAPAPISLLPPVSPTPPVTQIPDLDTETPPLPELDGATPVPETEKTSTKPPVLDMEEDDYFDPEEDPDDVGPPPSATREE